jgi:hypothetical protein
MVWLAFTTKQLGWNAMFFMVSVKPVLEDRSVQPGGTETFALGVAGPPPVDPPPHATSASTTDSEAIVSFLMPSLLNS